MPSRSPFGEPSAALGPASVAGFSAPEWELLVRLPGRVIVSATSLELDRPGRTVAEGIAGVAAIAAGRAFDSDLVRAVVAAIYAESDGDGPTGAAGVPTDGRADLLASCREAARVLARRADPADSAAYRQWVQSIAARGFAAGRSGPLSSVGGARAGAAQRQFLNELGAALELT
ncbi:hypothetical protein SAMN05444365_101492 [Micromonospora pattaloongensis]|uniref:Uncharacterized protein n=1 Tax=Micromonospora pattaloongensis TaxID=405436 RepID=A0A1H3GNA5_9ACTN|nr:hypothetical protein [Micromonospora pattaloongensis]SDY04812.1 hypothetical protein SAMN05444365_101492 [Micromonospora pattaloongensis]